MIISRTPFRISFFGGGTDYPVWFEENGGAVLASTIDKYCYITCRYLPPFFKHRSRIVYSVIENVESHNEIRHPAVRETLKYMGIEDGVEIHHDGDLPARAGLGSSSSFTVGLLHSLFALKRVMPTRIQLAQEAIHVERNILAESVGSQDQVSASFGGLNKIDFRPDGEIVVRPVTLARDRLDDFQAHLMLFFTGLSRSASEIAAAQIANTRRRVEELRRMREMVDEGLSILIGHGPLEDFGGLLNETWELKRRISDKISTGEIDQIYDAGIQAGALGGKLLGAGGGGFLLFYARPEDQPAIGRRLKGLLQVPVRLETGGSQIILNEPGSREVERVTAIDLAVAENGPAIISRMGERAGIK